MLAAVLVHDVRELRRVRIGRAQDARHVALHRPTHLASQHDGGQVPVALSRRPIRSRLQPRHQRLQRRPQVAPHDRQLVGLTLVAQDPRAIAVGIEAANLSALDPEPARQALGHHLVRHQRLNVRRRRVLRTRRVSVHRGGRRLLVGSGDSELRPQRRVGEHRRRVHHHAGAARQLLVNLHRRIERLHRFAVLVLHEVRVQVIDEQPNARLASPGRDSGQAREPVAHVRRSLPVRRVRIRRPQLLVVPGAFRIVELGQLSVGQPAMPADVRHRQVCTVRFAERLHHRALIGPALRRHRHRVLPVVVVEASTRVEGVPRVRADHRHVVHQLDAVIGQVAVLDVAGHLRVEVRGVLPVELRPVELVAPRGTGVQLPRRVLQRRRVVRRHQRAEHAVAVPAAFLEPVDEELRITGDLGVRLRQTELEGGARHPERAEPAEPVHRADHTACYCACACEK